MSLTGPLGEANSPSVVVCPGSLQSTRTKCLIVISDSPCSRRISTNNKNILLPLPFDHALQATSLAVLFFTCTPISCFVFSLPCIITVSLHPVRGTVTNLTYSAVMYCNVPCSRRNRNRIWPIKRANMGHWPERHTQTDCRKRREKL